MNSERKAIWGWALYDWANSAFAMTIMAVFFPLFFEEYWSDADINVTTARVGYANSTASVVVALMAPILGAIADRTSSRKKFLLFFAYLGVLMTAALTLVGEGNWAWAVILYAGGAIGFAGSNVFYDSLLPEVAPPDQIDRVSGLGFGLGYLGGALLFSLNLLMVHRPDFFGLVDASQAVRCSFLTVAVWWAAFTLFTWAWVPEPPGPRRASFIAILGAGIGQFFATLRKIRQLKTVVLFLLAYWLYIDGVDTIVKMASIYGRALGFDQMDLALALLLTQFVAFPAAILYCRLGERWGVRKAIFLALTIYTGVTLWAMAMDTRQEFYALAIIIGLVQGGIQALSRSYYSRLIPKGQAAEFYGFYNMLGKFATILGPVLMGGVGLWARSILMPESASPSDIQEVGELASRVSIASLLLLFAGGAAILCRVDERKGAREAMAYSGSD